MKTEKILLCYKDFTDAGDDRFFLFSDNIISEKNSQEICSEDSFLICHDYWLIAPALFKNIQTLPDNAIDIYEFNASISGSNTVRKLRDKSDIKNFIALSALDPTSTEYEAEKALITKYFDMFYKKTIFELSVYENIARLILTKWTTLKEKAISLNENSRFFEIEVPIFNILYKHTSPGIFINEEKLREHKSNIEYEYYKQLKNFSSKFSLPLEVPSDNTVIEYLQEQGYNFDEYSVDYVLEFVPTSYNFSDDVINIRKINSSRNILSSVTYSQKKCTPIIDIFGSITSRIYFKDPVFQNMAKHHRNIISADVGKVLTYVDYDQFEVGIMAALSEDSLMLSLYQEQDIYKYLAERIFGEPSMRKLSKRLFLSYAYGMKMNDLVSAAQSLGADRNKVREFFRQFNTFEAWKKQIHNIFFESGEIGTINGNFLRRDASDQPLTEKEKRSCVSQVVQGTASLIFKKALIAIHETNSFRIILPMHDAVLVEHSSDTNPSELLTVFIEVMSSTLGNKVKAKASFENFFNVEFADTLSEHPQINL
ncbi:DNA polymerase [Shewanella oncorhynchi]|uniref:DNA polymerase n=1 Tax=Shewanella oncorhynchi TaxID=2726434 RepID=UPI003D7AB9FC